MENNVFFGENGLTSTSANHLANIAKEYYTVLENKLKNNKFYSTTVNLIGQPNPAYIHKGITSLSSIQDTLKEIYECKSLIAWLREAIKAKENMILQVKSTHISDYAEMMGVELPQSPSTPKYPTEDDYINSMDIKARYNYFKLETELAVIGQAVHQKGYFNNQRDEFNQILDNPNVVQGAGRDSVIYTHIPTVSSTEVDKVFFELQKKHRELQAQFNAVKHNMTEWIEKETLKLDLQYKKDKEEWDMQYKQILHDLRIYQETKIAELSKLKIVIPNDLKPIYDKINSLGK